MITAVTDNSFQNVQPHCTPRRRGLWCPVLRLRKAVLRVAAYPARCQTASRRASCPGLENTNPPQLHLSLAYPLAARQNTFFTAYAPISLSHCLVLYLKCSLTARLSSLLTQLEVVPKKVLDSVTTSNILAGFSEWSARHATNHLLYSLWPAHSALGLDFFLGSLSYGTGITADAGRLAALLGSEPPLFKARCTCELGAGSPVGLVELVAGTGVFGAIGRHLGGRAFSTPICS